MLLMVFATIMAMVNGSILPLMVIVFGDMTDSFVYDASQNMTESGSKSFFLCLYLIVSCYYFKIYVIVHLF